MKHPHTAYGLGGLLVLSSGLLQAQTVNVDWGKGPGGAGTGDSVLYTGAAAVGLAGDFWNGADAETNDFTQLENLLETDGVTATTFDVTWTDELQSSVNAGAIEFGSTGHNALMEDYAFTNTDTATITISDLPVNADYTLHLYGVPDGEGQGTRFSVTGSNEGTLDVTVGNVADDNGLATPDDYVVFTGSTGAGGSIVYTQTSYAGGFSGSNGFQLDVGASGGVPDPPSAPVLSSPADMSTDASVTSTTLTWNAATDAATYNIFLWKSSESMPGTPTASQGALSYDVGLLEFDTEYSWLIQASNVSGTADSATWTFTTESAPPPIEGTLINVDWLKNGSGVALHTGAGVIGNVLDSWNGTDSEANVLTDLENVLDSTGAATDIDVVWSDELQSSANPAINFGTTLNSLMVDYAFTQNNGDIATVTISSLPENTDYTLYLLGVPDGVTQDTEFAVAGANETAQVVTAGDNAPGTGPLRTPEDYVTFTGNTGSGGEIIYTQTAGPAATFSGSNGFQLLLTDAASGPQLKISLDGSNLDFEWESTPGMLYDLIFSNDLGTAISTWPIVAGQEGIPADGSGTNTLTLPLPSAEKTFYSLNEYPAPPPPPLFSEDFEAGDGGFTVATTLGTAWAQGTPDSDNEFNLVIDSGNGESTGCFAVGLGTFNSDSNNGYYAANTATILTSPAIDLTGITAASLTFAEAVDFDGGATGEVYVIDGSDAVLGGGPIYTVSGEASADWADANGGTPIALPAAAMGQSVRIEWRFTGGTEVDWLGWYIDDVAVNED